MRDGHCTSVWKWPRSSMEDESTSPFAGSGRVRMQPHEPRPRLLIRPVEEILIVDFLNAQAIAGEQEADELAGCLMKLAREGQTRMLLNLAGVRYVSSSLLASLAWLHQRLTSSQGFLRLYGLESSLLDALECCGLDRTFAIYPTEHDALESAGFHLNKP
jgi:anti-anti-sigma factor